MEKSALAGEGGGGGARRRPTPFHSSYHHVQSCSLRSSWEGSYTPPISSLPPYLSLSALPTPRTDSPEAGVFLDEPHSAKPAE